MRAAIDGEWLMESGGAPGDGPIPRLFGSITRSIGAAGGLTPRLRAGALALRSLAGSAGAASYFKTIGRDSDHGGIPYVDFLALLNAQLAPKSYFEIGTESGESAARFACPTICIDPQFNLSSHIVAGKRELHLYQMTSDAFFAGPHLERILPDGPDIAFLDGMHRFEYLLRDFINTEMRAHSRSLLLLHDCLPQNQRMTSRLAVAGPEAEGPHLRFAWTGDVWKIIPLLKKYRPDLHVVFLDCPPTGLVAVSGLDPASRVLGGSYHEILAEFRDVELTGYGRETLWRDYPTVDSRALAARPHDLTLFLNIY
jgi:hypothetical protein